MSGRALGKAGGTSLLEAVSGTDGDDRLRGTRGDDHLQGLGGSDRLQGGAGDDSLEGGDGRDILQGGRGIDTFIFNFGETSQDVIRGFDAGETIVLQGYGDAVFGDNLTVEQVNPNLSIVLYDGDIVTYVRGGTEFLTEDAFLILA